MLRFVTTRLTTATLLILCTIQGCKADGVPQDPWRIDGVCDSSNCTVGDIWRSHGCAERFPMVEADTGTESLFNSSVWMLLRGTYLGTVGFQASTLLQSTKMEKGEPEEFNLEELKTSNGIRVKAYPSYAPGGARGIFAGENIASGTWIWDGNVQGARFASAQKFRRFILSLPEDLGCEMLVRCYPDATSPTDYNMVSDLDEGVFIAAVDGHPNLGCDEALMKKDGASGTCARNLFAIKDINAGEELLMNPERLAVYEVLPSMGLGSYKDTF